MFGVASGLQVCFARGSADVLSHSQWAGPTLELPPQWYSYTGTAILVQPYWYSHTGTWKMEIVCE